MPLLKKNGLYAGLVVIVLFLIVAAWWVLRPSFVPLFDKNLSEENTAEVLAALMSWGVNFEQDESTSLIQVPEHEVVSLRKKLGAMGIPSRANAGLELFTQGDYGMSEFAQKINYQRALEGELSRSIRSFEEIRFARVHLTLAKNSIFENRKEVAKASVVVQLKPEKSLTGVQVGGIQQLVSGAVPGLLPEAVVVIDDAGRPLSGNTNALMMTSKDGIGATIEKDLENKALKLLAGMFPRIGAQVSVRVIVNLDKVKSVREEVIPSVGTSSGYLVKRREIVSSGSAGKISDNNGTSQSSNNSELEYTYSREHSETEKAVGKIERVSIGIVLSQSISEQERISAQELVVSGLGLDLAKGDKLSIASTSVKSIAIETIESEVKDEQGMPLVTEASTSGDSKEFAVARWVGVAGILIVLFLLIIMAIRRKTTNNAHKTLAPLTHQEREKLLADVRGWLVTEERSI